MTLPNYIVNWDEIYSYLVDNLDAVTYHSIKDVQGVQKSKGFNFRLDKPSPSGNITVLDWTVPTSMVLTAINLAEEDWENGNTWTIEINDVKILNQIRTLKNGYKINWKAVQPLNEGDTIRITKEKGSKLMSGRSWINIEYIDVLDDLFDIRPQPPSIPSLPEYEEPVDGLIVIVSKNSRGEAMENVSYQLLDEDGELVDSFSVGYNGVHTVRTELNKVYEIVEVVTPEGYEPFEGESFYFNEEKIIIEAVHIRRGD